MESETNAKQGQAGNENQRQLQPSANSHAQSHQSKHSDEGKTVRTSQDEPSLETPTKTAPLNTNSEKYVTHKGGGKTKSKKRKSDKTAHPASGDETDDAPNRNTRSRRQPSAAAAAAATPEQKNKKKGLHPHQVSETQIVAKTKLNMYIIKEHSTKCICTAYSITYNIHLEH